MPFSTIDKIKKHLTGTLILTIFLPSVYFSLPQKADAFWPTFDVGAVPSEVWSGTSNSVTAINSSIQSTLHISDHVKKFILDPLAMMLAKIIIQDITSATVNWINNGFNGNPAFVRNSEQFFIGVADQSASTYLSESNSRWANFVCSPFSAKVRLALIQSYLNTKTQNKCSIGSVIKNWESFGTNFYGNGGWDGWFNLTQNSSNNPLGAYLEEKDSLNSSMNSKLQHYQNQLTQGNGFLSWETCADSGSSGQTTNGSVRTVCTVQSATGSVNGQTIQCSAPNYCPVDDRCVQSIIQTYKNGQWVTGSGDTGSATVDTGVSSQIANCPSGKTQVNTPGSVIEKQLANTLGEPLAELGVAQSINQIVGALLVQMVKSVVGGSGSGGLSGLSQSSSGSSSLQSQLDPNSSAGTAQFNTEQNQITKTESTLLNQSSGGSNTTTTQQTKPTITLIGIDGSSATGSDPNNPMNWKQGQIWQEPGAVSSDPTDGDLTAKIVISGNVDVNTPGTYTLTYTVTNSQGVSSDPVTRTVQVISAVSTGQ